MYLYKLKIGQWQTVSEQKLKSTTATIESNNDKVARITTDWNAFVARIQNDMEGIALCPVQLDGVKSAYIKVLAEKLYHISENATTDGNFYRIGELYGFKLQVMTENSQKTDILFRQNRFSIEGEGNIRYTHNNGAMAADPKLAVSSFLRALEKRR